MGKIFIQYTLLFNLIAFASYSSNNEEFKDMIIHNGISISASQLIEQTRNDPVHPFNKTSIYTYDTNMKEFRKVSTVANISDKNLQLIKDGKYSFTDFHMYENSSEIKLSAFIVDTDFKTLGTQLHIQTMRQLFPDVKGNPHKSNKSDTSL